MSSPAQGASHNRAGVLLFVEDDLTKAVLDTLYRDRTKRPEIVVAHGREAVTALVKAGQGLGLVDRDFGKTNRGQWASLTGRPFVLESKEIENLLLDPTVLAGLPPDFNQIKADEARILAELVLVAEYTRWWLAAKNAHNQLYPLATQGLPREATWPKRLTVAVLKSAAAGALTPAKDWCNDRSNALASWDPAPALQSEEARFPQLLPGANAWPAWQPLVSGKEILTVIRTWLMPKGTANSIDFAKTIARTWSSNPPSELRDLLDAIEGRLP